MLPPATLGLPIAQTWKVKRELAKLTAQLVEPVAVEVTPAVEAVPVDALPAWPLGEQAVVALSESSSGHAITTQTNGADLQHPGWEPVLRALPDADATLAVSRVTPETTTVAPPPPATHVEPKAPRPAGGQSSRPPGRGIGRSSEEGTLVETKHGCIVLMYC